MADYVLPLDHPSAQDPAVAGGKGASLAKLIQAGLPVPAGFVVTADAFAKAAAPVSQEIAELISGVVHEELPALDRACRAAREKIVSRPLPRRLAAAIRAAYGELDAPPVAVRSSATAEDMPNASFAGQYDTFLNVTSARALLDRTRDVWASLYATRAVAYRRRQGIADDGLRMAVVVQRQLPAQAAGVLFTRDPVTGADGRFVVNAALGLGEGAVDGSVPADRFALNPRTGRVVSKEVAKKGQMLTLAQGGGLTRTAVGESRQSKPALGAGHLRQLALLARSAKRLLCGHQDIEFAVVDGTVHLLQARPVTAIDAAQQFKVTWDDPADAKYTWMLSMWTRGPARRMEEEIQRAMAAGSRVCFEKTGSPMARNHILHFIDGFCFARSPRVDDQEVGERLRRYGARAQRHTKNRTSLWEVVLRPPVERRLAKLGSFRPRGATLAALVRHLELAVESFGHVMGDLHWRFAAAGIVNRTEWSEVYHEITGEPPVDAGIFLQAVENKTTRMVRWMRSLARDVQSDRKLRAAFAERAYERLAEPPLRDRPAARRFRARFRNFLRQHGRRTGIGFGSASDFTTPTWGMKPQQPLDMIAAYAEQDLGAMERMEAAARRERERATRRIRRTLVGDPVRLERFERELFAAQEQVRTMENHNHMMEQATGGAMREAIDRVGRRLVRDGLLDDPDDVFHLSLDELKSFAKGRGPADLRALVEERKEEFERRSRLRPPKTIGSGGGPPANPMARYELPPNVGRDGMLLRGVAASRGRATGKARVAQPSAAPPHVEKGDILVAVNAGPNWTPVFPLLSGLVLDQGAVFQHAALVAREYRIPTVIMTRDGTSAVRDGQTITVDGDEGVVELNS